MVASIISTKSMEEIAEASGSGLRWQQMFPCKDRSLTLDFVRRAEMAGFKAVVITVDSPVLSQKMGLLRTDWDLPAHLNFANFPLESRDSVLERVHNSFNPTADWEYIRWLCSITHLPIVVKGVLTAEDAELAIQSGATAILVSNHGGRQLNSAMATVCVIA